MTISPSVRARWLPDSDVEADDDDIPVFDDDDEPAGVEDENDYDSGNDNNDSVTLIFCEPEELFLDHLAFLKSNPLTSDPIPRLDFEQTGRL